MNTALGELIQNDSAVLQALKEAVKQEMHCALPGIIHDYDPQTRTASVQPAIRDRRLGQGYENLPLLLDVPVLFPGGAGLSLSYPLHQGDECLLVFADGCIDAWFSSGSAQNPVLPRRHDLSDAFALPGVSSKGNVPPASEHPFSLRLRVGGEWTEPLAVTAEGRVLINGAQIGGER